MADPTDPEDRLPTDPEDRLPPDPEDRRTPEAEDDAADSPGEVLFRESGGSWWVVLIGPALIAAVVAVEASGPGSVHWPVLAIFLVVLTGFAALQVFAARKHVSVELTETTLRQGVRTIPLSDIRTIYPENTGAEAMTWESAPALGELSGVPRRRKGVGVTLTTGSTVQAWARDHRRFLQELSEAVMAVQMGLGPTKRKGDA